MSKKKIMSDYIFNNRQVLVVPSGTENNVQLAMTALENLSDFGFTLDAEGVKLLSTASKEDITEWYYDTEKKLQVLVGADKKYEPLYPNFPQEVMDKSEIHYWGAFVSDVTGEDVDLSPKGVNEKEGIKSLEEHPLKVLRTVNAEDIAGIAGICNDIFQNTCKSKTTPSIMDLRDKIIPYTDDINPDWSLSCSRVENRMLLSYLYLQAILNDKSTAQMPKLVVNDYLRIAQMNSAGIYFAYRNLNNTNISLEDTENCKISSLAGIKNFMVKGLSNFSQSVLENDMKKNENQWKAVLHRRLHIMGDKKYQSERYEALRNVADKMYRNKPLLTYDARLEVAYQEYQKAIAANQDSKETQLKNLNQAIMKILNIYSERPGVFVKNINRLALVTDKISDSAIKEKMYNRIETYSSIIFPKTKTEDLIRIINYLNSRKADTVQSVHNVKGKTIITDKFQDALNPDFIESLTFFFLYAIKDQTIKGKVYGKVYIEDGMSKIATPATDRSGTESMKQYPAGSRIPIEKNEDGTAKNMRMLLWFGQNGQSRWGNIIDISAGLFKKQADGSIKCIDEVAWYTNRKSCLDSAVVFSGDWIGAGTEGATEFHDIYTEKLKEKGVDYLVMYVNIWSGNQDFSQENVYFGWQERDELNISQQMDPKAVKQFEKLSGNAKGIIPVIVDIKAGEIITLDALDHHAVQNSSFKNVKALVTGLILQNQEFTRMSLKDLTDIAIEAGRGVYVETPEEADTIISVNEFDTNTLSHPVTNITSTDRDVWLGEFMTEQTEEKTEKVKEVAQEATQQTSDACIKTIRTMMDNVDSPQTDISDIENTESSQTYPDGKNIADIIHGWAEEPDEAEEIEETEDSQDDEDWDDGIDEHDSDDGEDWSW